MSKRLAFLAASTALVTLSAPATAQDGWVDEPQVGAPYATDIAVEAADAAYEYESREVVQTHGDTDGEWAADRVDDRRGHHGDGRRHGRHHSRGDNDARPQAPRLAYSPAERAEWLGQCRALHARPVEPVYYEEDDRDGNEGLIGGLIGAVVGGFVGNRANDGDRLLGTVIGAGAGGLAGAVIGSVIDGLGDDADERDPRPAYYADEAPAFDYCEAYLLNYERGYGTPVQMAYAPVMMVPTAQVPMQRQVEHRRRYQVIEEEVEVDTPARSHHLRHAPAPQEPGKLIRTH